jgi:hypothetical protein
MPFLYVVQYKYPRHTRQQAAFMWFFALCVEKCTLCNTYIHATLGRKQPSCGFFALCLEKWPLCNTNIHVKLGSKQPSCGFSLSV